MKRNQLLVFVIALSLILLGVNWAISNDKQDTRERNSQIDTRIDNMSYWVKTPSFA